MVNNKNELIQNLKIDSFDKLTDKYKNTKNKKKKEEIAEEILKILNKTLTKI